MKIITQNKKAFFDYEILDRLEAGIVLTGNEVKSVRMGHISLVGAYAVFNGRNLMLLNCNISPYSKAFGDHQTIDSVRSRTLLLHRKELNRLLGDVSRKGITLIPLKVYINEKGLIKVEIGIAKHKKAADKRESIKEKDIKRETARALRGKF